MKSHARVVVVGGGIMGVGLLYHLALEGWSDVVLVEKGELTSGSTWHAAGQCPHFNSSLNLSKVHLYGTELYPKLEKLTGQAVSWHGCGGLRLATTDEEVDWLRYVQGVSRLAGYECEIIGPSEIAQYHPFLDPFGVKAAFRTFNDGHVAPADVTNAMAAGSGAAVEALFVKPVKLEEAPFALRVMKLSSPNKWTPGKVVLSKSWMPPGTTGVPLWKTWRSLAPALESHVAEAPIIQLPPTQTLVRISTSPGATGVFVLNRSSVSIIMSGGGSML